MIVLAGQTFTIGQPVQCTASATGQRVIANPLSMVDATKEEFVKTGAHTQAEAGSGGEGHP